MAHLTAAARDGYYADQTPAIGDDGTIYAGGSLGLYAIRPDGTEKWHFDSPGQPANVPVHFVLIDDIGNIWFDLTSERFRRRRRASARTARAAKSDPSPPPRNSAPPSMELSCMATSASVLQLSTSRDNPGRDVRAYAIGMAFTSDGGMVFTRAS